MKFKELKLGQSFTWADSPVEPTMIKMVSGDDGTYGYRVENEHIFYYAHPDKEVKIEIGLLMFLSAYTGI